MFGNMSKLSSRGDEGRMIGIYVSAKAYERWAGLVELERPTTETAADVDNLQHDEQNDPPAWWLHIQCTAVRAVGGPTHGSVRQPYAPTC